MGGIPDRDSGEKVSALEEALREAIEVIGPERVLRVIADALPVTESDVIQIDTSRFHGKVQKVSVSMPEDLTAAIRERAGAGGFSRYVTEAAEQRVRTEGLGEYLDELDEIYGPVPRELLDWAERQWPDYDGE